MEIQNILIAFRLKGYAIFKLNLALFERIILKKVKIFLLRSKIIPLIIKQLKMTE